MPTQLSAGGLSGRTFSLDKLTTQQYGGGPRIDGVQICSICA